MDSGGQRGDPQGIDRRRFRAEIASTDDEIGRGADGRRELVNKCDGEHMNFTAKRIARRDASTFATPPWNPDADHYKRADAGLRPTRMSHPHTAPRV